MKRPVLRGFAVAALAFLIAGTAFAQAYPVRPIKVIIPFPPGDAADIMARLIGPKMAERLGQALVVENRAGASGQIGLEIAARAAPPQTCLALRL